MKFCNTVRSAATIRRRIIKTAILVDLLHFCSIAQTYFGIFLLWLWHKSIK